MNVSEACNHSGNKCLHLTLQLSHSSARADCLSLGAIEGVDRTQHCISVCIPEDATENDHQLVA